MVAGHLGGSLTHGADYLSFSGLGTQSAKVLAPPDPNGPLYDFAIQPIFNQNCVNCHGSHKSKGKLRLDTADHLFHGGDSGPVIVTGTPSQSLLIKRLHLSEDEDEHMPPNGKPQLTADQITLLEWWIGSGASTSKSAKDLDMPADIQHLLPANTGASL